MEDTLRALCAGVRAFKKSVLILVLMEDTLRDDFSAEPSGEWCLNPCFNGRYSQRKKSSGRRSKNLIVLILVLMEDTLRDPKTY